MDGYSRKDERCPQLLDLISKDSKWLTKSAEQQTRQGLSEERKLELRLGPPGEHWATSRERNIHDSLSSFPYFANPPWQQQHQTAPKTPSFLLPVMNEPSQACSNRGEELQTAEKKKAADTAVHNSCSSQKRCPFYLFLLLFFLFLDRVYSFFFLCIYLYMYLVVHAFFIPLSLIFCLYNFILFVFVICRNQFFHKLL